MAENKMKEVAKLLGVELEEEFKVYGWDGFCKITELGLERYVKEKSWFTDSIMLMDLIKGTAKIIKIPKQILEEKEKEYLSAVIKPFRDRISYIVKCNELYGEYIEIDLRCYSDETDERTMLPFFKKGTMYQHMATNRRYTLEELGL